MISRILQGDGQNIYVGGAVLTSKIVLGGQSRVKWKHAIAKGSEGRSPGKL